MVVVRPILAAAVLATTLGLLCELLLPASGQIVAAGAAVFGVLTWTVPFLWFAIGSRRIRAVRTRSLASVGLAISTVVVAASLSAAGLSLGFVAIAFGHEARRAWLALLAIAAFWISTTVWIGLQGARRRQARRRSAQVASAADIRDDVG
ncbi:MAG: hypothetical protein JO366_00855 [Methylobacteriaceae bacterium]|nr:hypothetical protein [Methylobacteriaceae bacterium]MBV9243343.1 hypothetical protein [Methylobacteriaceae bacterium]